MDHRNHGARRKQRMYPEGRSKRDNAPNCTRCGRKSHGDKTGCPALGKQCDKCGKKNHFSKMCRTNTGNNQNVHVINEDLSCASPDGEDLYVHTVSGFSNSRSDQPFIKLKMYNKYIDAKIDTGSQVNILPGKLFEQLNVSAPLSAADIRLTSYSGDQLTDYQFQCIAKVMKKGRPRERGKCPKNILEFWNHRDEMSYEDGILFQGQKVVIPIAMRSEMVKIIHDSSHQGCNQASRRARDIMFWPGMTKAITNYVLACPLCERYRHANMKEPLLPHAVPTRPWQHLSCDIFAFENSHYLITVDAYSRHFEIDYLPDLKSTTVI